MRGPNVGRSKADPFRIPPALGQLSEYPGDTRCNVGAWNKQPSDIFEKQPPRAALLHDANGVVPEVSLVVLQSAFAGERVALARDARSNEVHASAEASAVEGSGIRPHRRWSHSAFFHRASQDRGRECFPLNVADDARAWSSEFDGSVEPAASAGDAEDVEGR